VSAREVRLDEGTEVALTSLRTRRRAGCVIGRPLAAGGTAKVYEGRLEDGSHVVLKSQRFHGEPDPAFEVEVELFKKLFHRNIVHCVGVGSIGQNLVIAFRRVYQNPLLLMSTASVDEAMRRDRKARYPSLPLDTAIDFGYELLNALDYLERLGFVHHDVKLSNIMIDVDPGRRPLDGPDVFHKVVNREYRGVLIDFGATRSRAYLEAWNRGEAPEGLAPQITPVYAPPESLVESRHPDGELRVTFDPSLDVYAAALVLYALVTGYPPYSHLRQEPDPNDLESVIGIKSAERRREVEAISAEVIQRVVFEDTRFDNGDRAAFDLAFYRFLAQRLDPDPATRGTASQMKKEFERLCHIRTRRSGGGPGPGRGAAKVFLPFAQELVTVGGRGEHPLMRAARLYGMAPRRRASERLQRGDRADLDSTVADEPAPAPAGKGRAASQSDSNLGWLDAMDETSGDPPSRRGPSTRRRSARPPDPRQATSESGRRKAVTESGRRKAVTESGRRKAVTESGRRKAGEPRPSRKDATEPTRRPVRSGRERGQTGGPGAEPGAGGEARPNPYERPPPAAEIARSPHCLVSPVFGDPVLLSRERAYVIGRDSSSPLRIKSDLVSRKHAAVSFGPRGFQLSDLGSLNGTRLNGFPLSKKPCPLHDGDRIVVGGFEVTVRVLVGGTVDVEGPGGTTRLMVHQTDLADLADAAFSGDLHQLRLRDVVEILERKRHSGTLTVSPPGGGEGRLFFRDGQIVHAESPGARAPLDAAVRLLGCTAGRFAFAPGAPRCASSIERGNREVWAAVAGAR